MNTSGPIRVAFVLPSFAGGGAERVMLTLLERLDRTQFAPSLVVLSGVGPLSDRVPGDLPLTDLKRPRLREALPDLRLALRDDAPDLVFSTMAYLNAGLLALRPFLPPSLRYVVREANVPLAGLDGVKRRLQALAYSRLYRHADAIVCPSRRVMEGVASAAPRAASALTVIYNPVDAARVRTDAANPARHPGSGVRLVAVGRLTHQKGFDRLIGLMPDMPAEAHLTIIGEGPERARLSAQIEAGSLVDKVTLAGFSANPWAWIAGADALLLPSRWEGLPNVALEALACGTPVVATPEAGGIDEIAERTPEAVSLRPMGKEYLAKMAGINPRSNLSRPGKSLLPDPFTLQSSIPQYEELLSTVATC